MDLNAKLNYHHQYMHGLDYVENTPLQNWIDDVKKTTDGIYEIALPDYEYCYPSSPNGDMRLIGAWMYWTLGNEAYNWTALPSRGNTFRIMSTSGEVKHAKILDYHDVPKAIAIW
jgi:hypothetical protein